MFLDYFLLQNGMNGRPIFRVKLKHFSNYIFELRGVVAIDGIVFT